MILRHLIAGIVIGFCGLLIALNLGISGTGWLVLTFVISANLGAVVSMVIGAALRRLMRRRAQHGKVIDR